MVSAYGIYLFSFAMVRANDWMDSLWSCPWVDEKYGAGPEEVDREAWADDSGMALGSSTCGTGMATGAGGSRTR